MVIVVILALVFVSNIGGETQTVRLYGLKYLLGDLIFALNSANLMRIDIHVLVCLIIQ